MKNLTRECLFNYDDNKIDNKVINALSFVLFDFITSLVDEIKYENNDLASSELIKNYGSKYIYSIITQHLICKD